MENQAREQVENLRFVMKSPWTKNRSKYMCLHTIMEGEKADLVFILFYSPVPYMTVESSLKKWIRWGYIKEVGNGCYILGAKGRHFLQRQDKKIDFIVDSWCRDMATWRSLPKDCCKTPDGLHWLPKADMIKILDDMKFHQIGTRRLGSRAGRPALRSTQAAVMPAQEYKPQEAQVQGPVCGQCGYGIMLHVTNSIIKCNKCGFQDWDSSYLPLGKSVPPPAPAPAAAAPTPPPEVQQEYGRTAPPRCPQCHGTLDFDWRCKTCGLSFDDNLQPRKGQR